MGFNIGVLRLGTVAGRDEVVLPFERYASQLGVYVDINVSQDSLLDDDLRGDDEN